MNKWTLTLAAVGAVCAALLAVSPLIAMDGHEGHQATTQPAKAAGANAAKPVPAHAAVARDLKVVATQIDAAILAIEKGNAEMATAHLMKAKASLARSRKVLSPPRKIMNSRCPIMGSKLDPDNVPASLTRLFRGHKVGFCCQGCPGRWDKLSEAEQARNLGKMGMARPAASGHSSH